MTMNLSYLRQPFNATLNFSVMRNTQWVIFPKLSEFVAAAEKALHEERWPIGRTRVKWLASVLGAITASLGEGFSCSLP